MKFKPVVALGLMSGTSVDGVDAALIVTDGEGVSAFGPRRTYAYGADTRARIRAAFGREDREAPEVRAVAEEITRLHADAAAALLAEAGADWRPELVGFHGQTILHAPDRGVTVQIGDGARLARLTGTAVVADFRSADVAAGGQGAPLVPVFHRALVRGWTGKPAGWVAVLNLGGVANLTAIAPGGAMIACDTGPGNALIDDWVARHGAGDCDRDGRLALAGTADAGWIAAATAARFFVTPPPKALDRDAFAPIAQGAMTLEDGAATLAGFTVRAVAVASRHLPEIPAAWVVTGGGRRNPALMRGLAAELGVPVLGAEQAGWDGDALEAQAFGYLAARSVRGLPLSFPGTTGVPRPTPGGVLYRPE